MEDSFFIDRIDRLDPPKRLQRSGTYIYVSDLQVSACVCVCVCVCVFPRPYLPQVPSNSNDAADLLLP